MNIKGAIVISATFGMMGCVAQVPLTAVPETYPVAQEMTASVKLSAVGYGAASSIDGHTQGQKRLLAMRASRLDAYRALAEQVYGLRLTGNTTVSSLMSQNDSFRAYIDAYLRGARVVSVTPMAEGNYETTIEIDFDERIARPYLTPTPAQPLMQPVRTYVAQPATTPGYVVQQAPAPTYVVQQAPAQTTYVAQPVVAQPVAAPVYVPQSVYPTRRPLDDGLKGTAGPGRSYGSSFYYAE